MNMKLPRPHSKDVYHNTTIKEDLPWKLQQIQVNKKQPQLLWNQIYQVTAEAAVTGSNSH